MAGCETHNGFKSVVRFAQFYYIVFILSYTPMNYFYFQQVGKAS